MAKEKKNDLAKELTADLQRLQAEFINFKRRAAEDHQALLNLAKQDVLLQLLPLLDNIDRAADHLPSDLKDNDWAKGVVQIIRQADEVFASLGVAKIPALGETFDPKLHEAVGFEGEGDKEIISEELQAGYRLGERVLRPAMVKVRKEK